MKLSVVIPVYNEVRTLQTILDRVRAVDIPKEIVLVDDFSTDGTRDLYPDLKDQVDKIVLHEKNKGKGAAIRTGLQYVTGDVVIIQDADLEYDPQEYHLLLQPIIDDRADVVYGSRFLTGKAHRVLFFWHSMGNKFLTLLSNMFTNLNLTDMETCYKMIRTSLLTDLNIEQDRFGFEPEITAKLARMNVRIFEVGISYDGRGYDEGKKIGWKDGFNAIWCILKYSRGRYRDYGKQTLEVLEDFGAYADLMISKIRPHLGKRIMEAGCGIGNNVPHLLKDADAEVIVTDFRDDYVDRLRERFGDNPKVTVTKFDAVRPIPEDLRKNPPESIVCLNVLEHIQEDRIALSNFYQLLPPGGRLVVLVPAFQSLYCRIDENLEHYRRYTRKELSEKFEDAGFAIRDSFYFNPIGAIGWFVAGKILRASQIKPSHVTGQKLLMPITRFLTRFDIPFGLSVVVIGEKPVTARAEQAPDRRAAVVEPIPLAS